MLFDKIKYYFGYNTGTNTPSVLITPTKTDDDIKEKSIADIKVMMYDNNFKLTNQSMHNAFLENNKEKMSTEFGLKLPCNNGMYHIDVATEEGDFEMVKYLVTNHKCQPSLYAKQMAHINGNSNIVFWLDANSTQRNKTTIDKVHKRFNRCEGTWIWNKMIPTQFTY